MKALREKVDIPKCSWEAAGPPGHRASVNHLTFIPRISMCAHITPQHTALSVFISCQDCIPLAWGLTEVGAVLLILCPHCCYMGNVFQVWRCTVARCRPSVITLLPKAEATGWQRKMGRKPGLPNHGEIQSEEACLAAWAAPQPCGWRGGTC